MKGEVGAADMVAVPFKGDNDPVIIELKTGFTLSLFHQAIHRPGMVNGGNLLFTPGLTDTKSLWLDF